MPAPISQLEREVKQLQAAVSTAATNTFLPHAVRDAIVHAGTVIRTLADEVNAQRIQAEVYRDKLHELRQEIARLAGQAVH